MAGPRIRTLKPEWLEDEQLLRAGSHARVLSVALILVADDYGRGRCIPEALASQVFPFERESSRVFRESLARLSAMGFVAVYRVRGQQYFELRNWGKHQKVDKPGKPRVPTPEASDFIEIEDSRESREDVANDSRGCRESLAPDRDQDQDLDQDLERDARARAIPGPRSAATAPAGTVESAESDDVGRTRQKLTGRVSAENVATQWHRIGQPAWQTRGVLNHPTSHHRESYEVIRASCNATPDPAASLAALLEYFWRAPHGPIATGRITHPAPSHLARNCTRDFDEALAWKRGEPPRNVSRATVGKPNGLTVDSDAALRPERQPFPKMESRRARERDPSEAPQ